MTWVFFILWLDVWTHLTGKELDSFPINKKNGIDLLLMNSKVTFQRGVFRVYTTVGCL